jgi:2-polyprenyl-6-methoxyphenol hydroxylase-like FAD-dependent oxidoreductase
MEEIRVRCCVVGGGPAGMMLGFLLARAGVNVLVLEKHADFLRDFRGDTVHPSTLQLMYELGLLEDFLRLPHQKLTRIAGSIGDEDVWVADFSHLPTHEKCIVLMPQWDFLNFLADCGRRYPKFQLRMQAEAIDLISENGRVTGVKAKTPQGDLIIRSDLVVGTDGRNSIVREKAGLTVQDKGAPMDVFWMRISRKPDDPAQSLGRFNSGHILVMINRGEYWQCAYVIPKGTARAFHVRGIESFRKEIARIAPALADRVSELRDWNDVKLLTVKVDRLKKWYKPGVLCIGDAAHAMSPIGGVGINLAVQDAVAAANILAEPLAASLPIDGFLRKVQYRREFPTRVTQRVQILAQDRIISKVLSGNQAIVVPDVIKLMQKWPQLQRLPARLIGIGVRPEHIKTSDMLHRG